MSDATWTGPVRTFSMPIEIGTVAAFGQAIGQRSDTVVPPTFAVVADRFDPGFSRRPPSGRGWEDGPPASHLHVEQHVELGRALRIGETVTVRRGLGRQWEKQGRSGRLRFVEERTELVDADGALCVAMGWVDVHTEAAHRDLTNRQRADDPPSSDERTQGAADAIRGADVAGVRAVDPITVTHFVRYVGATGDFHPLHHDDAFAKAAGYRSVFAPGMLTMAITLRALTEQLDAGVDALASVSSRFRAQVWPGDALFVAVDHDGAVARATTRNQLGAVVLETSVTLRR
jgi:peroxisomal enoyl-CoA hydratase 2